MTTEMTYRPVTVSELDRDKWDMDGDMAEGQGIGMAAVGFTDGQFPDDHPAAIAWERTVDEAIAEIGPQVRDLLYDALQRRLPWTWEPAG